MLWHAQLHVTGEEKGTMLQPEVASVTVGQKACSVCSEGLEAAGGRKCGKGE